MPYIVKRTVLLLVVLSVVITPGDVQIAMPMYVPAAAPQPVYAVPAPLAVAVAIQPERKTTTATTTTTAEPARYAIVMPVPVPMPVQVAVPAQPPPVFCQGKPQQKACPPCPPCVCLPACTPAFFSYCSPCHQKCRCRNPADVPVPFPLTPPVPVPGPVYPIPMPLVPAPIGPPPVVVVPLPPIIQRPDVISSSDSDDTSDSCDSSGDSYYFKGKKLGKKHKRRKTKYRRIAGDESERITDLVKPVLSYVSENGDVKFKTKLSKKDALRILNNEKIKTSNEKQAGNTETDEDSVVVVSNGKRKSGRRYNKVLLRESPTNHRLNRGKSKYIFQPPSNKKIKNVAVSFQVT